MMPQDALLAGGRAADDAGLVRRIAGGDRAAFESLMRRFNGRLFRLARATLGVDAEAEEALQEAYVRAWLGMGGFRGEASLSTWLSRLVLNECLARRRRVRRRDNIVPMISEQEAGPQMDGVADDSPEPDREVERQQMRELLERKVSELPESFRVVFVLRSVEDLDVGEVASVLGLPEETVRSRHFRARSLLRESLARDVDLAERELFRFDGARCDRIVREVLERLVLMVG
ncbi:MAG: RNA polymerase sigma factor [Steroidobacteraceae bacterium]